MAMTLNDVDINDVYDFMETGSMERAPEPIRYYVELLDKVRGMHLRIDRWGSAEAIIKHLIKFDGLSRYRAKQVYEETLEYFYCESHVSKKAWKNIYADKIDMMINFAMLQVKDLTDASKVAKMIVDAGNLREIHVEDKEELPKNLFDKPIKVYSADAAAMGLPVANRNRLKELIDKLPELNEKERARLYQEADIDNSFTVFTDEQADPRKT